MHNELSIIYTQVGQ